MKRKINERRRNIIFAVMLLVIVVPNAFLVIQSTQHAYQPWIDEDAIKELRWVADSLYNSTKPLVFVISSNEGRLSGDIQYFRNVISVFVPNNLVYIGKLDYLLLFREPQFENSKLQGYAERYWNELKTQVGSPQNLTAFTIVIIDHLYQPITSLELDTRLSQVHDGVYVVKNYTATNRLILFGDVDYFSMKGPWYSLARNWSSSGTVLELYAIVSVNLFVTYSFHLYESGNYTITMVLLDDRDWYVPVRVTVDNLQILLIKYTGARIPRTYNSTEMSLAEGSHNITVSPAQSGWLFFNLDYIEIEKIGS